ncbi:hypothetical protein [Leifsonia sp. LS-T14]|uniref:hypothetical protein n=1 Tax=unclassified Leifsonia TaxID=2663824 RepID=UPI0035A5CC89
MTHRPFTFITAVSLVGLAVFLGILQSLFAAAAPSRALTGDGRGPGYLSSDGWWLGAYHFDDGALGFCLNAGKLAPVGLQYSYADPAGMGWWTAEQSAVFAYISRTWAGSGDRLTAGAGQLATWMYAGMSDVDAQNHAGRAGADTDAVYARALQMLAEAKQRGSTGVRAAIVAELADTGPGRVRVELTVDRLSGPELLPAGAHSVTITLQGATFADGTATASIRSGTDVPIVPADSGSTVSVSASATASGLPYGKDVTVALPTVDAQAILIARSSTVSAAANTTATGPSPLPFQPIVQTETSTPVAEPGAAISDRLTVGVREGDGLLPTWGVRPTADGLAPVPAVVQSTLYGPFTDPIVPSGEPPAGAPSVCTVETAVDGAGEYTTPSCIIPAAGYYVWTERIDPSRTAAEDGGARLKPWTSTFGVATEVTRAEAPVAAPSAPREGARPAATELADTGSDVIVPALAGGGATAAGAGLIAASGVRSRRTNSGRRARRPRGRRAGLENARMDSAGLERPGRLPRVGDRRLAGPRRARSTWVGP